MLQAPVQDFIDVEELKSLHIGRRQLATEWPDIIHGNEGENWRLIFPFAETFENSFKATCNVQAHCHRAEGGRLIIFLNDTEQETELDESVNAWLESVTPYVAVQDLLCLSFCLDYTRTGGDPGAPYSTPAALRLEAKCYDGQSPTKQTLSAAGQLADLCLAFLNHVDSYQDADCVVAMPSSDPDKSYTLPLFIAKKIAVLRGIDNLSGLLSPSRRENN